VHAPCSRASAHTHTHTHTHIFTNTRTHKFSHTHVLARTHRMHVATCIPTCTSATSRIHSMQVTLVLLHARIHSYTRAHIRQARAASNIFFVFLQVLVISPFITCNAYFLESNDNTSHSGRAPPTQHCSVTSLLSCSCACDSERTPRADRQR
jgi:hypothetical protein